MSKIIVFMHVCSFHMKLTVMANFTCRYFRDQSATNICKCHSKVKTLESASGKATVLSFRKNRHYKLSAVLPVMCVLMAMYMILLTCIGI